MSGRSENSTILSSLTAEENEEQHTTNVHKYYSTVQRMNREHGDLPANINQKKLYKYVIWEGDDLEIIFFSPVSTKSKSKGKKHEELFPSQIVLAVPG